MKKILSHPLVCVSHMILELKKFHCETVVQRD